MDWKPICRMVSHAGLQAAAQLPHPLVLAAFKAPQYAIDVYRGAPGFRGAAQDPASKRLSYVCSYHDGGPQ